MTLETRTEWTAPDGRMLMAQVVHEKPGRQWEPLCNGCYLYSHRGCFQSPMCTPEERADGQAIIWVTGE